MLVTIESRSGRTIAKDLDISGDKLATVADLKKALYKKCPKYSPSRQRLTYDNKPLTADSQALTHYGIKDGDIIIFKDLGPQISWRTVFIVEYLGPILIHPLFYFFGPHIYGANVQHDLVQRLSLYLAVLHFVKREFETIFIHRFSNATMPIMNIFKNSFHYWILSGVLIAWEVYAPKSVIVEKGTKAFADREWEIRIGVGLWVFGEISNFITHLTLRNLRPPGTTVRKIPRGYGFDLVSCPNYFFETVAWIGFCLITRSWAALFFTAVAFAQMYVWAVKKHKNYRKDFKDYPKDRKAMVPFLA
ncbi:3-oxo-5-alpha-steroid 4-dehydrogenase-domain-containing protein [Paraphysoderma sedebokerense]|nr:3-oxo-5-alpha-steroid 4-dehydrogenase-domain-containing protein [Paraphysoderma sedebokerense]